MATVATVGAAAVLTHGHGSRLLALFLGAVVLGVVGVLLRRRPDVTAGGLVAFFAVQPALKFFVSVYFGPAKDALVLVVAALWLSRLRGRRWRLTGRDRALALFTAALLVLYVLNPAGRHDAAWLDGTRLVVESFGLLLLGLGELDARRAMRGAVAAVLVVGALEALYGVFQQAVGFAWIVVHLHYAFGDQVRTTSSGHLRSFGTFDDAFSYGSFELLALVASFTVPVARTTWRKLYLFALRALLLVGAVVGFVRTDWVILGVLAVAALLRKLRRSAWLPVLGGTAAFGIAVLMSLSSAHVAAGGTAGSKSFILSLNGRTLVWDQIVPEPFALVGGDGVGRFGSGLARSQVHGIVANERYRPGVASTSSSVGDVQNIDSSYLATLADVGIPGLLLVLACAGRLASVFSRADRAGEPWGALGLGWLVVIGLDSLTRSSMTAFPSGYIELYLLGLLAAAVATLPRLPARVPLNRLTWPPNDPPWASLVVSTRAVVRRNAALSPPASAPIAARPAAPAPDFEGLAAPVRPSGLRPPISLIDAPSPGAAPSPPAPSRSARSLSARWGVISAVGSRLGTKAIGLIWILVLARSVSPQRFAEYSYLLVTAGTLATVTDLGVASVAAREVAGDLTATARAYRAAIGPQALTASAAAAAAVVVGMLAPGPGVTIGPLAMVAAFVIVNGVFDLQAELLRASGRPGLEGLLQLLSAVLQTGLCTAVLLAGAGLLAITGVIVVAAVAVAVVAQTALPWPSGGGHHRAMRRTLLRSGVWLGVGTTAVAGMWRVGQMVVSNTAPVGVVADYAAGARFLDLGTALSYTLGIGLLPSLVRRARDSASFTRHTRVLLGAVFVGVAAVAVPASLLSGPATALLFGSRYRGAGGSAVVFVLAMPVVVVLYVAWFVLVAQRRERWGSVGALVGLAVAAGSSLIFLGGRDGGAHAAALCTVAGAAACSLVLLAGALRRIPAPTATSRSSTPPQAVAARHAPA